MEPELFVFGRCHVQVEQSRDEPEGVDKGLSHLTRSPSARTIVLITVHASQYSKREENYNKSRPQSW